MRCLIMAKKLAILFFIGILILGAYLINEKYLKNAELQRTSKEEALIKEENIPESTKEMMAKKVNQSEDNDKLVKTTYMDVALQVYSRDYIDAEWPELLNDIDNKFPIQCLRKSGAYYYSIHKSNRGGYMYILYEYDRGLDKFKMVDKAIMYKTLTREDFNSIKVGKSNLTDVFMIDPEINYFLSVDRGTTVHFLKDGGLMRINYSNKKGSYIVTEVKYDTPRKRSVARYLLPQDFPDNSVKNPDKSSLKATTIELINKANNEADKDDLIKNNYEFKFTDNSSKAMNLNKNLLEGKSMEEINTNYKIECLREREGYYYSIHKSTNGRYLYLLYKYNVNRNEFCVIDEAFLYHSIDKESFENIRKNKSTFEDVLKIDPNTICEHHNGIATDSLTLLKNGELVDISYKSKNSKEIVDNLVIRPPFTDKNVLRYVEPKDLPK